MADISTERPPPAPRNERGVSPSLLRALLAVTVLGVWWIAARGLPPYILPGPEVVAQAILKLAKTQTFFNDMGATLGRVVAGFAFALVIGTPLGLLFGSNQSVGAFFEPILPVLNTVSSAIWAIFAMLWFGLSNAATIFVVFMTAMPLIITNVWTGTRNVDPNLVEVALSLRFGRLRTFASIYLPSILPYLFSGARLAFGFGWRVSLVAETLGASSGVGYRLRQAADLFQADQVFAWTIIMVAMMIALEAGLLRPLERRLFRWQKARSV
ncbi:MAG TPA: ABC transporter permease [Hansschlegelia sp.]